MPFINVFTSYKVHYKSHEWALYYIGFLSVHEYLSIVFYNCVSWWRLSSDMIAGYPLVPFVVILFFTSANKEDWIELNWLSFTSFVSTISAVWDANVTPGTQIRRWNYMNSHRVSTLVKIDWCIRDQCYLLWNWYQHNFQFSQGRWSCTYIHWEGSKMEWLI